MTLNLISLKRLLQAADPAAADGLRIPYPGRLPFEQQLRILGIALLLFLALALAAAYLDHLATIQGTRYVAQSSRLLMLSQRLAKDAQQALAGADPAFEDLSRSREQMSGVLRLLDKGDPALPATSGKPRRMLDQLVTQARKLEIQLQALQAGRPGLVAVQAAIGVGDAAGPPLREMLQELAAHPNGADPQRALRLALQLERLGQDTGRMLGEVTPEQVERLQRDLQETAGLLQGLPAGDPLAAKVRELVEEYRAAAGAVIGNAPGLLAAKHAGRSVLDDSAVMQQQVQLLVDAYQSQLSGRLSGLVMTLAGGMVLLLLLLMSKLYLDEARRHANQVELANRRNRQAILRLTDEMVDLAGGDLTVRATVSHDITGTIAEAVNYTTGELRKLVAAITDAAAKVAQATGAAQQTVQQLLEAAQEQQRELRHTAGAVELITQSVQEIDRSALQSAQVAHHTLEMTEQGARAVRNTMAGMDAIRAQIQETAKRIKRLGESSQEIGEIVELIADITEQTNVLALNAAIQAAGEAGPGYSLVAEEVQRLAERSAAAAGQIGTLVKTIQRDTQDAAGAMEQSTQGVVEGGRLAQSAEQALRQIEQISRQLAALISNISVATQTQAQMAQEVAAAMANIQDITAQAGEGAKKTSDAVTELAELAIELRVSVSGFRLPQEHDG